MEIGWGVGGGANPFSVDMCVCGALHLSHSVYLSPCLEALEAGKRHPFVLVARGFQECTAKFYSGLLFVLGLTLLHSLIGCLYLFQL